MDNESEIRKLEHKLSEYRSIIGQQEEMLLQVTTTALQYYNLYIICAAIEIHE